MCVKLDVTTDHFSSIALCKAYTKKLRSLHTLDLDCPVLARHT